MNNYNVCGCIDAVQLNQVILAENDAIAAEIAIYYYGFDFVINLDVI